MWKNYLLHERFRPSKRALANDPRNDFESDFGRVLFSPALRRMHDKTQVFPLTTDDNIHTRLTHSLEVMAIGHTLGLKVAEDTDLQEKLEMSEMDILRTIPVILKNTCLVHDIGNPPFGHFGETAIQGFFDKYFKGSHQSKLSNVEKEDFTKFDGNAQGFRVLTKLQALDDIYGLNLTFATLATYLKYPNTGAIDKKDLSQKKRGVFQSERLQLIMLAEKCDLSKGLLFKRHPLAFLMEAADSICYLVMDIEDGFKKKYYNYEKLRNFLEPLSDLKENIIRIESEHCGEGAELARVVNLRIFLIGKLVNLAFSNFKKNLDTICAGDYKFELIKEDPEKLEEALSKFCIDNIYSSREICSLELTGHSVLSGLLNYFIETIIDGGKDYRKRGLSLISDSIIRVALLENHHIANVDFEKLPDYYKLRIIVDYISGMTDQFAVDQYQKLSGQKIS